MRLLQREPDFGVSTEKKDKSDSSISVHMINDHQQKKIQIIVADFLRVSMFFSLLI